MNAGAVVLPAPVGTTVELSVATMAPFLLLLVTQKYSFIRAPPRLLTLINLNAITINLLMLTVLLNLYSKIVCYAKTIYRAGGFFIGINGCCTG
jgi:hypothetical protein